MARIRVLIVDDHPIVRFGLRMALDSLGDIEVVGEAGGGHAALDLLPARAPDVLLVDLVMPEMDGAQVIAATKRAYPSVRAIALTAYPDEQRVVAAVQAGADGFLVKSVDVEQLAQAVRIVHAGRPYLDAAAARHLVDAAARPERDDDRLTDREREVLALVGSGRTNRQIAAMLGIAEKTVSVHVSRVLTKLSLSSRTQAALYAAEIGLVANGPRHVA
jgi:DNA-binding NarL/FixJ family response regulator